MSLVRKPICVCSPLGRPLVVKTKNWPPSAISQSSPPSWRQSLEDPLRDGAPPDWCGQEWELDLVEWGTSSSSGDAPYQLRSPPLHEDLSRSWMHAATRCYPRSTPAPGATSMGGFPDVLNDVPGAGGDKPYPLSSLIVCLARGGSYARSSSSATQGVVRPEAGRLRAASADVAGVGDRLGVRGGNCRVRACGEGAPVPLSRRWPDIWDRPAACALPLMQDPATSRRSEHVSTSARQSG